jgi:hypothetical protein
MSEAMELTQREFDQIGSYVREHLGTWIRDISPPTAIVQLDPIYIERIVRVEEELESQRELMKQGFDAMDKRLQAVDQRFEEMRADMTESFAVSRSHTNHWMTFLTIALLVFGVAMTLVPVLVS